MSKLEIYKVKDKSDSYYNDNGILFSTPFRVILSGKSQISGKTSLVTNLLLRPEFYLNTFDGDDIYIFSPSVDSDEKLKKMIKIKKIPPENVIDGYDEEVLEEIYKNITQDYNEATANKEIPKNTLIIFDDLSYSGVLKKKTQGNMISKLFCQCRHVLISVLLVSQKYSDISTTARINANGAIIFNTSSKELELIESDHNYNGTKKEFMKMFRDNVVSNHDFLVVNYSNKAEERYLNSSFEPIKM
jgi:hypothetical protein